MSNQFAALNGWVEDSVGIQESAKAHGSLTSVASNLLGGAEKDVMLWRPLLQADPTWRRGSQGIGDCQIGSALVTMADGSLKRIDSVVVGEWVISGAGVARQVTAVIHKPAAPREMITVTTRSGFKPYTATVDHRVPVLNKRRVEKWKPVGTVQVGEFLVLARGVDEDRAEAPTMDLATFASDPTTEDAVWGAKVPGLGKHGRRRKPVAIGYVREKGAKQVRRWVQWDSRLAWLLGLYAAEGSTDKSVSNGLPTRITFNLGSHRRSDANKAAQYLSEIFDVAAEVTQVPSKPTVLYVRVSNRLVANFFYTLVNGNVYAKQLHKSLFTLPASLRSAFMRGWFDGDRHVGADNRGAASTASVNLARDIQRMCLSLGVEFSAATSPADAQRREAFRFSMPARAIKSLYPDWSAPMALHRAGEATAATAVQVKSVTGRLIPTGMMSKALKVERFVYEGPVYCLEVDVDHTFIGDGYIQSNCVGWGSSLTTTVLMAVQSALGEMTYPGQAASESDYGGCRVEALGKKAGGYQDGAFGYAVAKWVKEFGVVIRADHSQVTGNPEHDLRKYSKEKAKAWGNFGCGGQRDAGKLDGLAKLHPVGAIAQVKTIPEAIAALQNGYAYAIASMAGFGQMKRDADGVCRWVDEWAHQMMVGGLRWRKGKPQFRVFQSWGDSCSGSDPGIPESIADIWKPAQAFMGGPRLTHIVPDLPFPGFPCIADMSSSAWNPISACSWWCIEEDMARILRSGDCWSYSGVGGFKKRNIDFSKGFSTW